MIRSLGRVAMVLSALLSFEVMAGSPTGFWQTPAISGFGEIHPLPQGSYQPPRNVESKIVFGVAQAAEKPGTVNPALDQVARTINLYVSGGVALDHLHLVAVVYGAATNAVLDNEHYREKFGVDNPNLKLIEALHAAGVDVAVSGQAIAKQKLDPSGLASNVKLALSSTTTIAGLEQQGYAFMLF